MHRKILSAAISALLTTGASAAPVIYNNDIVSGQTAFDAAISATGSSVNTATLSGLASYVASWTVTSGPITIEISSTDGIKSRYVMSDYKNYRAAGQSYAIGGEAILFSPADPVEFSGLTFTFSSPINAFGLQVADWASKRTNATHPNTGAPTGSNLFIAFDGGAVRLVANATSRDSNPGNKDYNGDGVVEYVYTNFVGAVDDSSTFSSVSFYGDGVGENLYAGGVLRWATVPQGAMSDVPEPDSLLLLAAALGSLALARRRPR